MYLYDLREELLYCEGHSFVSEMPDPVRVKIKELAQDIDTHLKAKG